MQYTSLEALFNGPKSKSFQAALSGETGHKTSYYASKPRGFTRNLESQFNRESSLGFDVSNLYIQATVGIDGMIQDARSARGLRADDQTLRGVFVQKELLNGGPWEWGLEIDGQYPVKTRVETGLLENLIPVTTFHVGKVECRMITFAPLNGQNTGALPAVIQMIRLANPGETSLSASIVFPACFSRWDNPKFALDTQGQTGLVVFDALDVKEGKLSFSLRPGEQLCVSTAYLVGQDQSELEMVTARLLANSVLEWINQTLDFHHRRLGKLETADSYYGEGWERFAELCRQSELCLPDGSFAGGTLGSNVNPNPDGWWNTNVWMKDNFYAALPMALFDPGLCEQAILFYMHWGIPEKARGRGMTRYPGADLVTTSVSNALDGIALAVAYYEANGNARFFHDHPEFLAKAVEILDGLLATRQFDGITLFPSMYVSDGDARGDFHTGTNVVAWYAFNGVARLCREVYQEADRATAYQTIADAVRRDIDRYCKGQSALGEQYFEGGFANGMFVPCKDGEESDVALMPFYRFCEVDDPALTRFERLGFTAFNFLYRPFVDGIAWFDNGYGCNSTFPGFTSAIAGAQDEGELLAALERIRRLTDLDGSIWWWPHDLESRLPSQVVRWPVKCCWAAGVYVLKFVNDVLGIQVDTPAHKVRFNPFSPWSSFHWQGCRLGSSVFDLSYEKKDRVISATLVNRNPFNYEAHIELVLPLGATAKSFALTDEKFGEDVVRYRMRYGRSCYIAARKIAPGETLRFEIHYSYEGDPIP